jgi:hypothetical protein
MFFLSPIKLEENEHESREREKLFWFLLHSSGSHEKLYGPVCRLVLLQPALKGTGMTRMQETDNGAWWQRETVDRVGSSFSNVRV